jgi:hypothetical protein
MTASTLNDDYIQRLVRLRGSSWSPLTGFMHGVYRIVPRGVV